MSKPKWTLFPVYQGAVRNVARVLNPPEGEEPMLVGLEKVESIAQIVEKHFEGKAIRLIRGRNWYKVVGVEFDEQIGCVTLILEGRKPLLLWWNEKYVIAEIRQADDE